MTREFWPWVGIVVVGGLIVAMGATCVSYSREMAAIRSRLTEGSHLVRTRHGLLEYSVTGDGPPVLAVHGAGGGYDQGLLLARVYGGGGCRWIVPSRFGYLRSVLPADSSTAAQADAFADLLDSLGVERVAFLAMSGGVPPSLQFAERYRGANFRARAALVRAVHAALGGEPEAAGADLGVSRAVQLQLPVLGAEEGRSSFRWRACSTSRRRCVGD